MVKCEICGDEFADLMQLGGHWAGHIVRPVKDNPLSYFLVLPDGVTEGGYEAAETFANAYAELKQKHPNIQFHFLPFSYKSVDEGKGAALDSILAIAK